MSTLTDVMRTLDEARIDEGQWEARRQEFDRLEREKQRLYEAYERIEARKRNSPMRRVLRRWLG